MNVTEADFASSNDSDIIEVWENEPVDANNTRKRRASSDYLVSTRLFKNLRTHNKGDKQTAKPCHSSSSSNDESNNPHNFSSFSASASSSSSSFFSQVVGTKKTNGATHGTLSDPKQDATSSAPQTEAFNDLFLELDRGQESKKNLEVIDIWGGLDFGGNFNTATAGGCDITTNNEDCDFGEGNSKKKEEQQDTSSSSSETNSEPEENDSSSRAFHMSPLQSSASAALPTKQPPRKNRRDYEKEAQEAADLILAKQLSKTINQSQPKQNQSTLGFGGQPSSKFESTSFGGSEKNSATKVSSTCNSNSNNNNSSSSNSSSSSSSSSMGKGKSSIIKGLTPVSNTEAILLKGSNLSSGSGDNPNKQTHASRSFPNSSAVPTKHNKYCAMKADGKCDSMVGVKNED